MLTAVFLCFNRQCSFPSGFDVLIDSCFHRFLHVTAQQRLLTQVPGPVLRPGSQCKHQPVLACTLFRVDQRRKTNARQSLVPPGGQGAVFRCHTWGPRCPGLAAECCEYDTESLSHPRITSPSRSSPASAGLLSWAAKPSKNGGKSVNVRLNLSLDTHCLGDLRQISRLSESQFPSLLKRSD